MKYSSKMSSLIGLYELPQIFSLIEEEASKVIIFYEINLCSLILFL